MNIEQLNTLLGAIEDDPDGGKAALGRASVNDNFALISFLEQQRQQMLLTPRLLSSVDRVKTMFLSRLLTAGGAFWVIFSGTTKCHQELEGAGLIALDKSAAEYIAGEQAKAGYRTLIRAGNEKDAENILRGMLFNGFSRVRIYKSGCPYFETGIPDVIPTPPTPAENADLRFHAIRFLQEVRRGIGAEVLQEKEHAMLRAAAKANLYLPGKRVDSENEKTVSHPCIRITHGDKGQNFLPVYSAPQKLVQSPDFIKMKKDDPAWGMIRSNLSNLCRYCGTGGSVISGIAVDLHDFRLILTLPKMMEALSLPD